VPQTSSKHLISQHVAESSTVLRGQPQVSIAVLDLFIETDPGVFPMPIPRAQLGLQEPASIGEPYVPRTSSKIASCLYPLEVPVIVRQDAIQAYARQLFVAVGGPAFGNEIVVSIERYLLRRGREIAGKMTAGRSSMRRGP
jgi:hypothetical protein